VCLEAAVGSDGCFDRMVRDGFRDPDRYFEGDTVHHREWSPPRTGVLDGAAA
jgi:hypothetical protein